MSFSSYDPNARYRQRAAQRTTSFLVGLFALGIIVSFGYWLGGLKSEQAIFILEDENSALKIERDDLQEKMSVLRAEAQTANVRLQQLKTDYDELLSDGPMNDLLLLVRNQLQKGVASERLESVILSARPPQNCSAADNKRFVVDTPVYNGPKSSSSFAGGRIKISGVGLSAQDSKGQKESWFDETKPVKITFKSKLERKEKTGVLPLYHAMVVGDKEYRFTISAGAKSFAKVTYDSCDYP